jgi:hypothetical protein
VLTFAKLRQQHGLPIRELKGVMMGVRPAFVDLSEPGQLVPEPPSEEHACLASDFLLESKLGAGKHTNGHARVIHRYKAPRNGMRETR